MAERFNISIMGKAEQNSFVESHLPQEREWEFIDTAGVTVSGPPGSGTSTGSKMLTEMVGLDPTTNLIRVGDLRRQIDRKETGIEFTEDVDRNDPNVERRTDALTRSYLRRATPDDPKVAEAQLGGFIATKVEEQAKKNHKAMYRIAKILLVVDEEEGGRRVQKREEAKGRSGFTTEHWVRYNNKRHKKDLKNWRRAYPELRGIDPHDANAMDRDGERLWKKYYDIKIDTTFLTEQETADRILLFLWENGYIRKKKPELSPINQN